MIQYLTLCLLKIPKKQHWQIKCWNKLKFLEYKIRGENRARTSRRSQSVKLTFYVCFLKGEKNSVNTSAGINMDTWRMAPITNQRQTRFSMDERSRKQLYISTIIIDNGEKRKKNCKSHWIPGWAKRSEIGMWIK